MSRPTLVATAHGGTRSGARPASPAAVGWRCDRRIRGSFVEPGPPTADPRCVAPCGVAHAAAQLVAGLVVVACPSLALVAQTLRVWSAAGVPDAVLAVCSDTTVGDSAVHVSDLRCPVTTDAYQVAAWLRRTSGHRLRLTLVTHQSAAVLGQGLIAADATVDLLVVDEAHRTAGRMGKQAAALHYDEVLPARRRLYMTATPKAMTTRHGDGDAAALSMDSADTFGRRLFTYSC